MNQQEAFHFLNLDTGAGRDEIEAAVARKQDQLRQALEKAPTEALKGKYRQQLEKLEQVAEELSPARQAPGRPRAGLSQTKLADLPLSATQFDDGTAARVNLQAGQMLANRYEVQEQIGAGGMGAVYRALDKTTGKEIALKVLLPGLLRNERARERFLDEARISQQLSHPNIVNVYDVQQDGDFFFLTMELLEGQDLRQVMENRSLARQPFSEQEMRTIASQVCDALAYAHKYTVHRDLKPENIWLTEDGDYKLMDFGIARVQSTSQRTQTGAAMGTAYYMAPEQLKGQKNIDGRADQYALGVMLYELATGEVPAGMIKPIREQRKDLSKGFSKTIMRTLGSNREDRFADISAFKESLNNGGGFELNLPWKGMGIAAGVLVAVLGVGAVASSGSFSLEGLKGLLPLSKEEIAAQRASLAKIQGEIKVLKQRLESSRRSLDSDVREAERDDSNDLQPFRHWKRLTEDSIFSGSRITELEGDLAMAETLLQDSAFEEAGPVFKRVRDGYRDLGSAFAEARRLHPLAQRAQEAQEEWEALAEKLAIGAPASIVGAVKNLAQAREHQAAGFFADAAAAWLQAAEEFERVVDIARPIPDFQQSAFSAEASWQKIQRGYSLEPSEYVKAARNAKTEALKAQEGGNLRYASEKWRLAAEAWQQALDADRGKVAQIKRSRAEARAREEEQRQREAEQQRLADAQRKAEARRRALQSSRSFVGRLKEISGGSFRMGESATSTSAKPSHRVQVAPFFMMEQEVTFAQWNLCVRDGGCSYRPKTEGWGGGNRPVINVSYNDIVYQYIPWLNRKTGLGFRLPSEAEWEYAARAGSRGHFSWGNSVNCSKARYGFGSIKGYNVCKKGLFAKEGSLPVKSFSPNRFGLYDMHGNVWEITQDCYNKSYSGAPGDGSAWNKGDCSKRMKRGGSWGDGSMLLAAWARYKTTSSNRSRYTGFRLVVDS